MRAGWKAALTVVVAVALGLGTLGVVRAQQAETLNFSVTENRVPGAAGTGSITPLGNNQIRVDIHLTGMPPNTVRAAHIHTAPGARCDNGAPATYPLTNVTVDANGVGASSTVVTLTPDKPVQAGNAYVNVHEGASPPGNGVICANVDQTFTAGAPATGGASGAGLPNTGAGAAPDTTLSGDMLAALLALAALAGTAGTLVFARRR